MGEYTDVWNRIIQLGGRVTDLERRLDELSVPGRTPPSRVNGVTTEEQGATTRVIQALNKKARRAFRPEGRSRQLIVARLRAGFTVEDLLQVVWYKAREWNTDKMRAHLRPSTLFGRAKFDEYVDDARQAWKEANQ